MESVKKSIDERAQHKQYYDIKNQELVTSSYKEVIDQVEHEIKEAIKKIQSVDHPSIEHNKSVIINLKQKLERIWPQDQRLKQSQKEQNKSFTKYPKILSKFADPDISEAYRNVDFDSGTVNQVVITSLYHEGFDGVADSFIQESQEPDINPLRSEFKILQKVIKAFEAGNEVPALTMVSEYRHILKQNGSNLEFDICGLHYLKLLENSKKQDKAFEFAKNYLLPFKKTHQNELNDLLGWMALRIEPENSYGSHLSSQVKQEELVKEMTNQFFSIIGKNLLRVTIEAGARALPTLSKLVRVTSLNNQQEWETMKKLPVAIDLGSEFQFHSVFVCPVTGEESDIPYMLPCHHVISLGTINGLSKYLTEEFKCPVCESLRKDEDGTVTIEDVFFDICRHARISAKKEAPVNFLTDPSNERSTLRPADVLVFGWVGGKHACVDLTGVSPPVGLSSRGFTAGQVALKAASCKVTKHEKTCIENQHVFIPFAFDTFGSCTESGGATQPSSTGYAHQCYDT
uniref:Protein RMD5 homolog A-like n=1 Tax=Tanacetum cinerariifolium TaxID=118510 RepID=A0A6L2K1M9_TANCI|nr:protein RMD5 homolog A-like [Tanacetum cinerariifolium]